MRRKPLAIKQAIIDALKDGPLPTSALETKARTGTKTIANQVAELEYLGIITFRDHLRSPHNGRPYRVVQLTRAGLALSPASVARSREK